MYEDFIKGTKDMEEEQEIRKGRGPGRGEGGLANTAEEPAGYDPKRAAFYDVRFWFLSTVIQ